MSKIVGNLIVATSCGVQLASHRTKPLPKKNPDVAELARGKAGRVIGDLVSLLTVMKGLPLTYNKDMQEDKEPVFDAVDTLNLVLPAMQRTLSTARFNEERMRASLRGDFSTATDLADYLVRKGLPFREAHEIVGNTVRYCIEKGIGLEDLDAGTLATFSSCLDAEDTAVVTLLKVETSVHARQSLGGTSPVRVSEQWNQASERLHLAGF